MEVVSKANGFYGQLPVVIERCFVTNEDTIKMTNGLTNDELNNVFF